jgi:hypothetical protein
MEKLEVFDRYHVVSAADVTNAMRKMESYSLGMASQEAGEIGVSLVKARPRVQKQIPAKTRVVVDEHITAP